MIVRGWTVLINQFMPSVKINAATKKTSLIIMLKQLQKPTRKMDPYPTIN